MAAADVEAIGAHCAFEYCHQLDFLPFRCESCRDKFCSAHRTETTHHCPKAGAWATSRRQQAGATTSSTPKPTILTHESQCSHVNCKTLVNTPLVPGIECPSCNRSYCLKHRLKEDHDCANLPPIGARASKGDRGLGDALSKLRAWGTAKKASLPSQTSSRGAGDKAPGTPLANDRGSQLQRIISPFTSARKGPSTNSSRIIATNFLKRTAKGDAKIPMDKRIYFHLEAVAEGEGHAGAKIPRETVYYSVDWSVGKVLDAAAKLLHVTNVNNRGGGEEERLRVFWVDGGRLLDFGEKIGAGPKSGDTLILLRGVGAET